MVTRIGTRRWVPATTWCLVFAALHVFWALGGSVGLASSAGRQLAAERPTSFVLLGLWGVGVLLLVGAGVVYRCTVSERRSLRWLVGAVGALLLLRGLLVEVVLLVDLGGVRDSVGRLETTAGLLVWNPWFVLGGLAWVYAAATRGTRGRRRDGPRDPVVPAGTGR